MSMFGSLTAGYIREAIEKKIEEVKTLSDMNPQQVKHVIQGLELAKDIAGQYED